MTQKNRTSFMNDPLRNLFGTAIPPVSKRLAVKANSAVVKLPMSGGRYVFDFKAYLV